MRGCWAGVVCAVLLGGCGDGGSAAGTGSGAGAGAADAGSTVDPPSTTGTTSTISTDTEDAGEPHPIGMNALPFALSDTNPTSASYEQVIDSNDLQGAPYALIFMDSRCLTVPQLADDIWASYAAHPAWADGLPIFALNSAGGAITGTGVNVTDGNDLPYLVDKEETELWRGYSGLNHDMMVISADGKLEAWLPLYDWPADLQTFEDYMTASFGP